MNKKIKKSFKKISKLKSGWGHLALFTRPLI